MICVYVEREVHGCDVLESRREKEIITKSEEITLKRVNRGPKRNGVGASSRESLTLFTIATILVSRYVIN